MKGKRLIQMMCDISPEFEVAYIQRGLNDCAKYRVRKGLEYSCNGTEQLVLSIQKFLNNHKRVVSKH